MSEPQLTQSGIDAKLFRKPMPDYAQRIMCKNGRNMELVSRDDNGNGVHMKSDCLTSNYEVVSANGWSNQRMSATVNVTCREYGY